MPTLDVAAIAAWTTPLSIVIGAVFMAFGIIKTRQVIPLLTTDRQRGRWKLLFSMMAFFLLGYLVTLVVVLVPYSSLLAPLTGLVFLVGAMFVLQVVRVGFDTVKDLGEVVDARTRALEGALRQVEKSSRERDLLNVELAQALHLKDHFLASMTHELRTPLSGILGMSEALNLELYGAVGERQRTAISTIEQCGSQLLGIIEDILALSEINAGQLRFRPERTSLKPLIEQVVRDLDLRFSDRSIQCDISWVDGALEADVDPHHIQQVVSKLMSNAIKFSEKDSLVGIEVRDLPETDAFMITVWDHGVGIAKERLPSLFEPFMQGDASLAREHDGAGLGLSIASHLVDAHGGQIVVESEKGEGSRFIVTLPRYREAGS